MHPVTARIVPVEGAELFTEVRGTARRGTILLAMGATASMVWWPETLLEALAEAGFRVIRFDHRDTGRSTTHPPGKIAYDVETLAADLVAILDAYATQAAHLVGMSLGGYVGQIAALHHPDRVLTLTLIASEPLGLDFPTPGISQAFMTHFSTMATLVWTDRAAVTAFMLKIAALSAGSAASFDSAAATGRIEAELGRTASMQSAFNHSMIGGASGPELVASALRLPVLVIHGTEDPVIPPAAAEATAAAVPGAQLMWLHGRGHELPVEDVPQIAAAVIALTRGVWP